MTVFDSTHGELIELIELQLEEQISAEQFERLEQTIRTSAEARRFYLRYMDLHGTLHWNTARGTHTSTDSAASTVDRTGLERVEPAALQSAVATPAVTTGTRPRRRSRIPLIATSVVVVVVVGVLTLIPPGQNDEDPGSGTGRIAENDSTGTDRLPREETAADDRQGQQRRKQHEPIRFVLNNNANGSTSDGSDDPVRPVQIVNTWDGVEAPKSERTDELPALEGSSAAIIAFINERIQQQWDDHEVIPSAKADDTEWMRRVFLDVVGHIPTADQVRAFAEDDRADKRTTLIEELLDDEDYVRNWTTVWTNLLIGRSNPREVDRPALERFLRKGFADNRGWDETVRDFIAAEGENSENGATNFLLAHVNNQAMPATATTARLFLGQQIQCLQCHNHPFNDWKQSKFFSFHSFFQQMGVKYDDGVELVTEGGIKPTFFERRNGTMAVTWPGFEEHRLDVESEGSTANLRQELARLMTSGETTQVARAFVNRMWEHFFGAAFTPIIDDMGPHARASHPVLLEGLSRAFVRSGYDVKQLVRWICQSDAYNRTSRFGESNEIDDPSTGHMPLFSRVYVKPMSVEQLFDSVMIATQARESMGSDWAAVDRERRRLQREFAVSFDTEDNDEADLFNGTVPQALLMMNGPLVARALEFRQGTFLNRVLRSSAKPEEKIESLALAALSRRPTNGETQAVRQMIVANARTAGPDQAVSTGLQDLFWAYLNSNEFILIH